MTYEFSAVNVPIPLDKIVDVSILHPLGNQSESVFAHRQSKEWQDVGMSKVFPSNAFSTEFLRFVHQYMCCVVGRRLTLRMASRSLVMYMRTTLTATWRPSYVLRDTLANPPHSTSTEPSEQSGTFIDFGTTRCWLHILQSLLSNFTRWRSGMARSSRRCNSR